MNSSRRDFLKTASVIAAGSVLPVDLLAEARRKVGPNDKIQVGLIGVRSQGYSNLESFLKNPEVECAALCDVDKSFLDSRTADIEKLGFARPKHYSDYRKMLDDKDIDKVIFGTPDHWHCLKNNTPEKLNASLDIGRNVALVAQMGNIVYRTGEKVSWNDATQSFATETANALITPVYHNGYKLPAY